MKGGRKGIRTKRMIQIAKKRIATLFTLAEKESLANKLDRSHRYVELARKIGSRYNVRIPKKYRTKFCRTCNSFFLPSVTCRVRTCKSKVAIYCKECKSYTRIPFLRESNNKKMGKSLQQSLEKQKTAIT